MLSRLNSSTWMEDLTTTTAADDATAWSAAPSPSSTAPPPSLLDMDPTWYLSDNAAHNHPHPLFHLGATTSAFDSSFPLPDLFGFASGSNNNNVFNSNAASFSPVGNSFDLVNTSKILRPLDVCPPVGAQPTLFQKRLARQGSNAFSGFEEEKRRKTAGGSSGVDILSGYEKMFDQDGSVDGNSCLNYDSDEIVHAMTGDRMMNSNGSDQGGKVTSSSGGGGGGGESSKGGKNKKGLPAKNLMAERRRRKKLNDRLYMLRSVVPRISKMDRASILGDAIEYLKELLQRINDLHNELESTPSSSQLPTPTGSSFHPLTPTIPTLPSRVKEELCPTSLASPTGQPRVEVRIREGNTVNIHMFCSRRPGLLLSTMRALDGLGIDIQQAVISCFNGFALDVFRAEQLTDGPATLPEDIKAVLLHSAGYQGAT